MEVQEVTMEVQEESVLPDKSIFGLDKNQTLSSCTFIGW